MLIFYTRIVLSNRKERRTFNNPKFIFKHSFNDSPPMNFLYFSSQTHPLRVTNMSKKERFRGYPATRIQSSFGLPDRPETLIHPLIQGNFLAPHRESMTFYTFVFSSYLLLLLRERRWKRWLRGTEKLIISDTNLSGLLGGWQDWEALTANYHSVPTLAHEPSFLLSLPLLTLHFPFLSRSLSLLPHLILSISLIAILLPFRLRRSFVLTSVADQDNLTPQTRIL